jgi:hypothetical protein
MRNLNRVIKNVLTEKQHKMEFEDKPSFDYVEENEMFSPEPMYEIMLDEGETCEQCGGSSLKEGECTECGYMKEGEVFEKLYGNQSRLDRNKNGKLDSEDFKMLRGKKKESKEGNAFGLAVRNAKKQGKKSFELDGEEYPVKNEETIYELEIDTDNINEMVYDIYNENLGVNMRLTEDQVLNLIETLVEQKLKKTRGYEEYEKSHRRSGKENDDYFKEVTKKMKDYMKDGSEESFTMDAKHFPMGNGELKKMDKMAYVPSEAVQEYIDNFTAAALENLDFNDGITPNEDWMTDNIEGSSRTGNNPEWANAVETPTNKKRNKIRKDNLLGKLKRKAYNKSVQPVVSDKSGNETDKASKIMMKLESTEDKKTKYLNEEFERMKDLIGYRKNTQ